MIDEFLRNRANAKIEMANQQTGNSVPVRPKSSKSSGKDSHTVTKRYVPTQRNNASALRKLLSSRFYTLTQLFAETKDTFVLSSISHMKEKNQL